MKKIFKILFWILISALVLLVLLLSLPTVLGFFSKDIGLVDVSDLALPVISIPENENSYYDLVNAAKFIYYPNDKTKIISDYSKENNWNEEDVQDILSKNIKALAYLTAATKKTAFQDVALEDPKNISESNILLPLNSTRSITIISSIKALDLKRQGKTTEAVEEAFKSIIVAHQIESSLGGLSNIEYLVAVAMKNIGLITLQNIVSSSSLSSTDLNNISSKLNQYYDNGNGLKNSFKSDNVSLGKALDLISEGGGISSDSLEELTDSEKMIYLFMFNFIPKHFNNYYFQVNKSKKILADYTRNQIKRVDELCKISNSYSEEKLIPNINPLIIFTDNAVGKLLHDIILSSLNSIFNVRCSTNFRLGATQALVAIKSYKNDTGSYPQTLNDLIPKYLEHIPNDPYGGEKIKYSSEKNIIYSVGLKGVDEGGSEGDNIRNMANPTIKINFID